MTQLSSPRSGNRLRQRVLVLVGGLVLLLIAAWLALVILTRIDELFLPGELDLGALTRVPGVEEAGDGPIERINILMLGLDRRPSEGNAPARSDTMFVMTIDPQSETAGILGIPRDLWVDYPYNDGSCCYQERINAAYVLGETQRYWGGGPALAMYVVEQNLGIPIDHYMLIDFEGFKEIIDDLGGITVYIEQDVYDPFYSDTELPGDYFPLDFKAGDVEDMDGRTALAYARTRRNSGDLDRIRRQQQVIFAALDKARELNWNDAGKVPSLFRNYKDAIETDVNDLLVLRYAGLASGLDPTRITALSLGAATYGTTIDQKAVLLADPELVEQLVQALFNDGRLLQENAQVEVQNGAGEDGLAVQVVDFLAGQGFAATALTAADSIDRAVHPQTVIIDYSSNDYTVGRLANLLGVPGTLVRHAEVEDGSLRTTGDTDILVILGTDAQGQDFAVSAEGGD